MAKRFCFLKTSLKVRTKLAFQDLLTFNGASIQFISSRFRSFLFDMSMCHIYV